MNYKIIALLGLIVLVGLFWLTNQGQATRAEEITVYKDPNCGCCVNYIAYLKQKGFKVNVVNTDDRSQFDIPAGMESCHTAVIGEQIIEGHVPIEGIEAMLESNARGVALPGMPAGSPGMPGLKKGPLQWLEF